MTQTLDLVRILLLSAGMGAAIGFVPRPGEYEWQVTRASAFLATAGALMMMIVGNELARAFGLMGAASVVRYRYGLKSSRDASSLILSLGMGMACGSGMILLAQVGTATVVALNLGFASLARFSPGVLRLQRAMEVEVRSRGMESHQKVLKWFLDQKMPARVVEAEGKETREPRLAESSEPRMIYKFVYEVKVSRTTLHADLLQGLADGDLLEIHVRDRPEERL